MDINVGDNVRILAPFSIYRLWVTPVVAITSAGNIQVEVEPGVLDIFSRNDVKKV